MRGLAESSRARRSASYSSQGMRRSTTIWSRRGRRPDGASTEMREGCTRESMRERGRDVHPRVVQRRPSPPHARSWRCRARRSSLWLVARPGLSMSASSSTRWPLGQGRRASLSRTTRANHPHASAPRRGGRTTRPGPTQPHSYPPTAPASCAQARSSPCEEKVRRPHHERARAAVFVSIWSRWLV
jgi:hypothetical protein